MFDFIYGVLFTIFCFIIYKIIVRDEKIYKYLASPVDKKLEINWTTKQIFAVINKDASERWYEARAHCYKNIFISVLSTLHLIWIVRTEMKYKDNDMHLKYKYTYFHGFQSFESVKNKCLSPEFIEKIIDKKLYYYHQTFLCGHNVLLG